MADLRLSGALARAVPQGPAQGADPVPTTLAKVFAVDQANRRVQVRVAGGPVWLDALPARYAVDTDALVLWDVIAGRPVYVLGALNPATDVALAAVTAVSGTTVTVTWNGVATALPGIPGTYTVGQTAWVHTDSWNTPVLVLGPSTTPPPPAPEPPPPPPPPPSTVRVSTVLTAQWSGSWRWASSKWNDWNRNRYGWPSTMWQGNGHGSGPMTGLATFGSLFTNLGATSIDGVILRARRSDGEFGVMGLSLQESPNGSQPGGAPTGSGDVFNGTADQGGTAQLGGVGAAARERLRTGATRGFITVGSNYSGWVAVSATVVYTRPA